MPKNVKSEGVNNKNTTNGSSVMSKVACHYVLLPKVILRKVEDPLYLSTLSSKDKQVFIKFIGNSGKQCSVGKVSSRSKNIPARYITEENNKRKIILQTKKAVSTVLKGATKKFNRRQTLIKTQLTKDISQRLAKKLITDKPAEIRKRGRPRKALNLQQNKPYIEDTITETINSVIAKSINSRNSEKNTSPPPVVKTKVELGKVDLTLGGRKSDLKIKHKGTKKPSSTEIEQLNYEMNAKGEEAIMEELEISDSEKSFDESSDESYTEQIESIDTPRKFMTDSEIKKQTISKNVIKLSDLVKKSPGSLFKGGIIRKNPIPVGDKSKVIMKPNKINTPTNQFKKMTSVNSAMKQKMFSMQKQKQRLSQTATSKPPVPQVKQEAITIQSVEAINSKAKKSEPIVQASPKITTTKQTATVTPLTKARKSFATGPSKINLNSKISKENESGVVASEPVSLLSKLVGLPISASKLKVVSLSPEGSPTKSPPSTNIKNNGNSKTQYVTPTTHDREEMSSTDPDLLSILSDDNEASTSQKVTEDTLKNPQNINGNELNNLPKSTASVTDEEKMDTDENETTEEKQRTIYDLIADINLVYPSWNLHIMPDTNSFCIAQVSRGRLGIPVLKKCIELDEAYNAKVYVHQYHCKRFDGQYDSEESIIALIHEINALRA